MPRSRKYRDLTYRTEPGLVSVKVAVQVAERLVGGQVVVWLPKEQKWKRGYLIGFNPEADSFRIKWSKRGLGRNFKGIWRIHPTSLFKRGAEMLQEIGESATVPDPNPNDPRRVSMATARKKSAAKRASKPTAATRAAREPEVDEEPESNGASRKGDKLAGLTDARKRNIAKLIHRERGKKPATSWDEIKAMILEKYDWELPGSMTGRRLLREALPDSAEGVIIQQTREAKPKKESVPKKAKVVEEEELEEEELEEEELDEEELEEEDEELEDEEDEEEPEPTPRRKAAAKRPAKKVTVKRGTGRKS